MNTNLVHTDAPPTSTQNTPPTPALPPLSILIAAAICIVAGTGALVDFIVSLFRGHVWINLGFLAIPIGRGLLKGRSSSRMWALIFSGLGLIVSAIALIALMTDSLGWTKTWEKPSGEAATVFDLICGAIIFPFFALSAAMVFFGLRKPTAKSWCECKGDDERQIGTDWTLALFLSALAPAVLLEISAVQAEHAHRAFAGSLYHFDTSFEFRDTVTGKPVQGISTSGLRWSSRDTFSPQVSYQSSFSPERGSGMAVLGISDRPLTLTFSTDGRKPVNYTISKSSPSQVVLTFTEPK